MTRLQGRAARRAPPGFALVFALGATSSGAVWSAALAPKLAFHTSLTATVQESAKPRNGCVDVALSWSAHPGAVWVKDANGIAAKVTIADVTQSNGVIHVIDKVLMPGM
jgi:uncharacterized surface protein with fasciclin (FAS1) repeats